MKIYHSCTKFSGFRTVSILDHKKKKKANSIQKVFMQLIYHSNPHKNVLVLRGR